MKYQSVDLSELVGLTITKIYQLGAHGDLLRIETSEGRSFRFIHYQDCCEYVDLNDIDGDIEDVMNSPVLLAEEVKGAPPRNWEGPAAISHTWTFYKIRTELGSITLSFLGESNGYYSETVDFEEATR